LNESASEVTSAKARKSGLGLQWAPANSRSGKDREIPHPLGDKGGRQNATLARDQISQVSKKKKKGARDAKGARHRPGIFSGDPNIGNGSGYRKKVKQASVDDHTVSSGKGRVFRERRSSKKSCKGRGKKRAFTCTGGGTGTKTTQTS